MEAQVAGPRGDPRPDERDRAFALEPRRGGSAERWAELLGGMHPVPAFLITLVAGFVLAAILSVLLGLVVTEIVLDSGGVRDVDDGFVESLADGRTATLNTVADVGAVVGSYVLSGIAAIVAIVFAVRREWAIAAFAAFAPFTESALYRVTSALVPRERPDVIRLESLPSDASYPSGHVAASVTVYVGLMLVVGSRLQTTGKRAALWTLALALPAFVAFCRMYAGMHHPIDALAGVLVGIAAICVVAFACRTATASATRRSMY